MDFVIERLDISQITEAVDIIFDSFQVYQHVHSVYTPDRIHERLKSSFIVDDYSPRFVVAKVENKVIGIAGYSRLQFASRSWSLFSSAVDKDHRSNGIGTALVKYRLERIEEELGSSRGRVFVSTKHKKRFEKLGFVEVDNDPELDIHIMLKSYKGA